MPEGISYVCLVATSRNKSRDQLLLPLTHSGRYSGLLRSRVRSSHNADFGPHISIHPLVLAVRASLQFADRSHDRDEREIPVKVGFSKQLVGAVRRDQRRIFAALFHERAGSAPDIDIGYDLHPLIVPA